jgi:integral membrane sensor domain MASE1
VTKTLIYVGGFLSAIVAAVILLVMGQDVFNLSSEAIVDNSLASAGILSAACVVGTLIKKNK